MRGIDQGFGYNRTSTEADHLTRDDLVRSLIDIAAKGGNLLLNVGPRGEDAQIPEAQLTRLDWLAEWMDESGEAVQDTRPWVRAADRTPEGVEVRYTARGDVVWALCWWAGDADARPAAFTLPFATPEDRDRTPLRVEFATDADASAVAIPLDGMVPLGR